MNHWYVIRTKVGSEALAQTQLERQAYLVYYPRLLSKQRRFGCRRLVITPLFPQYLFLNLTVGEQDLAPAKSTKGVLNIVRFGNEYAVIPNIVIVSLREREDPAINAHRLETLRFKPQQRVRVTSGPFYGLEGVFLKENGVDRVTVLLNLLGRETPLKFNERYIEPC